MGCFSLESAKIFLIASMSFLAINGCKLTDTANSQVKDATSHPAPDLCRWSKASTYEELKKLALYQYDTPSAVYEPTAYMATTLSSDQVLEDLACLRLILNRLYSGTNVFKRQGVDLVARLDQRVESYKQTGAAPWSTAMLATNIYNLWKDVFDGHLSIQLISHKDLAAHKRTGFGMALAYPIFIYTSESLAGRNITSCGTLHLSQAFGDHGGGVFTGYLPGSTAPVPATVTCTNSSGQQIPIAVTALTENDAVKHTAADHAKGAILSSTSDGIDILKITSFPEPATKDQRRIAELIGATDRPLVIDVRGDGGGAPEFNRLLQEALFSVDQNAEYSKATAKYGWLRVLAVTQMYKDMDQQNLLYPDLSEAKRLADHNHYEALIKVWESQSLQDLDAKGIHNINQIYQDGDPTMTSGKRLTPRKAPVVVLTDRGCGSQCDFFVSLIRHLPVARGHILGSPTAGRLNFGNNGRIFLPNSHLGLSPSIASNTHIPAVVEGEGIQPDMFILTGDVESQGLSYMRQLLKTPSSF